jgi:hypothetical protein
MTRRNLKTAGLLLVTLLLVWFGVDATVSVKLFLGSAWIMVFVSALASEAAIMAVRNELIDHIVFQLDRIKVRLEKLEGDPIRDARWAELDGDHLQEPRSLQKQNRPDATLQTPNALPIADNVHVARRSTGQSATRQGYAQAPGNFPERYLQSAEDCIAKAEHTLANYRRRHMPRMTAGLASADEYRLLHTMEDLLATMYATREQISDSVRLKAQARAMYERQGGTRPIWEATTAISKSTEPDGRL